MATAPQWAQDLVLDTWLYWQKAHAFENFGTWDKPLPVIDWRNTHRRGTYFKFAKPKKSSGRAWNKQALVPEDRIVVTAGSERLDQRVVLLHELAHILSPVGEHHGSHFWDVAWELYRWAKIPIRYAKTREGNYRKGALVAYSRSRKGGVA